MVQKKLSAANPPVCFSMPDGREWRFLETTEIVEMGKNLVKKLRFFGHKYHCYCNSVKALEKQHTICRIQMFCTTKCTSKCAFRLLLHKTVRPGFFHLYGSGQHTCMYGNAKLTTSTSAAEDEEEEEEDEETQTRQQRRGVKEPPATFNKIFHNVEYNYNYLKTVHSRQELHDLRFEYQCGFPRSKFKSLRMSCHNSTVKRGGCPFALLAWRPQSNSDDPIHVYGHGEHNHILKSAEQRAMNRVPRRTIFSEEHAPANFTTPNGREWTFLETTETGELINEMDKIWQKYNCTSGKKKKFEKKGSSDVRRIQLRCTMSNKCSFMMLALKTDRGHFHLYGSDEHTCQHKNGVMSRMKRKETFPDTNPPANFVTPNNRDWTFLETVGTLIELDKIRKRKYHCLNGGLGSKNMNKLKTQCRAITYCLNLEQHNDKRCRYQLLAQKTDRGRFHLYGSGQHTCCLYKNAKGVSAVLLTELLPDAHPPASFDTPNGREWTFLETLEIEEKLADLSDHFMREYHCRYSWKNIALKTNRMTLYCTATASAGNRRIRCPFAVLAQKTDRGRLHVYGSDEHMCIYKVTKKSMKEAGNQVKKYANVKENEEEKDDDDEESAYDEEMEELEEEEEQDEEENKEDIGHMEIEDEDEEEEEEYAEHEEEMDDDEENEEEGDRAFEMTSNDEKEEEIVQFIDFVDHPKNEGVKMLRLGEPKKEPEADALIITLHEEETARKMKMPKREVIKEEAPEEQPGPSNRSAVNGSAALPMAAINERNKQPVARERWWAKEDRVEVAPKNEKRLLRERKRRINYQE